MMPGMDGPTVLARLRADKRTAAIPVVFVTAGDKEATMRERFKALGAAGVIAKPFDPMELAGRSAALRSLRGRARRGAARISCCGSMPTPARSRPAASGCRRLASEAGLTRINEIAHALAGAGGIYGFAGITCESAALSDAAENRLAGRARRDDVEQALDRLLSASSRTRIPT